MKRLARMLRRIANRLDPQEDREVETPLEFVDTKTLADEIRNRNDYSIVFWGRGYGDEARGSVYYHLKDSSMLEPILRVIVERIAETMDE